MGSMSLFTRNAIKCKDKDKELLEFINRWTDNDGWEFDDFPKFLELVGIKTPVQIEKINSRNETFKCISKDGNEYLVFLQFANLDSNSKIFVTEGNETSVYYCSGKSENPEPKVTKQKIRFIEENGKKLSSSYGKYFAYWTLKIDEDYKLIVEVDYCKKANICITQNSTEIEEYLFSLEINDLAVNEVYEKIIYLLEFSQEDIKQTAEIFISFEKEDDNGKQILACIRLKYGKMYEYAVLENGATYHIYKDKSWSYSNMNNQILYCSKNDSYIFTISGKEDVIVRTSLDDLLNCVKERIFQLWEFFK